MISSQQLFVHLPPFPLSSFPCQQVDKSSKLKQAKEESQTKNLNNSDMNKTALYTSVL